MAKLQDQIRNVLNESRILFFYGLWFGLTVYQKKRGAGGRKDKPIPFASK